MRRTIWLLPAFLLGCVSDSTPVPDAGNDATNDTDAVSVCDPTKPFGAPVALSEFGSVVFDRGAAYLSNDELSIYLAAAVGDAGKSSLMFASRSSTTAPFGQPALLTLPGNDGTTIATHPTVTADQLTLLFQVNLAEPQFDVFLATRGSLTTPFGTPQIVASVSSSGNYDVHPYLTTDNTEMWFASTRTGGSFDIWRATYSNGTLGVPVAENELNTTNADEEHPVLSADKLTIYFGTDGPKVDGGKDWNIMTAKRGSAAVAFGTATPAADLNSAQNDYPAWISPNGCHFYLTRDGTLYRAMR